MTECSYGVQKPFFLFARGGVDHGEALGAGRVRARDVMEFVSYLVILTKIDIRPLILYLCSSDAG